MRVLVLTATDWPDGVEGLPGEQVTITGHPCDCLGAVRGGGHDVLVVAPPVLWPAAAAVIEGAARCGVPVVVLPERDTADVLAELRGWLAEPDWAGRRLTHSPG
jgi:hypothetical protein